MPAPDPLLDALRNREVIPFVGAGVSLAVRDHANQPLFPTWKSLLLAAADLLRHNSAPDDADLVKLLTNKNRLLDAAREARTALGSGWLRFLCSQFIRHSDDADPATLELARAVWNLGSPLVLTTNYDRVLSWASRHPADLPHWTVSDRANLAKIHEVASPTVWHLHGFIDRPEELILTPDGYELLYPAKDDVKPHYEAALSTLRNILTQRSLLFIGFGMEESVREQIRWVRETFAGAGRPHWVLVHEAQRGQMEKELAGLSVQTVPFPDYKQPLLDLLADLAAAARSAPRSAATAHPLPRIPPQRHRANRNPRTPGQRRRGPGLPHHRSLHPPARRTESPGLQT